jgi:hypothetical protein
MRTIEILDKNNDFNRMAEGIAEVASRIAKDKINLGDGSLSAKHAMDDLKHANIKLKANSKLVTSNLSAGNSGADQDTGVGVTTLEIMNELIQDYSPEHDVLEKSPLNSMLPLKQINAVRAQQDIYESNYGWARPSDGVFGAINPVPLLEASGKLFTGYGYNAMSSIEGYELIKYRELGSSNLTDLGTMQKIALQKILLAEQVKTSVELVRSESLTKGSFVYGDVTIGTGIPNTNVFTASQSLGTYSRASNVITVNASATNNILKELGAALVGIQNMGVKITGVLCTNTVYSAIFQSPTVDAKTLYMTATSPHDIQGMRADLFENTNIPVLKGIPLIADDRAIKIASGITTTLNTRPIMYGETVDATSFRMLILTESSTGGGGTSRLGSMGFFPNVYDRPGMNPAGGQKETMGYQGSISLVTQDLSQFNWTNQRIQMIASSCFAPMFYLPNGLFVFDPAINVVA